MISDPHPPTDLFPVVAILSTVVVSSIILIATMWYENPEDGFQLSAAKKYCGIPTEMTLSEWKSLPFEKRHLLFLDCNLKVNPDDN
jgi:hypothetical protein